MIGRPLLGDLRTHLGIHPLCLCCCDKVQETGGSQFPDPVVSEPNPFLNVTPPTQTTISDEDLSVVDHISVANDEQIVDAVDNTETNVYKVGIENQFPMRITPRKERVGIVNDAFVTFYKKMLIDEEMEFVLLMVAMSDDDDCCC